MAEFPITCPGCGQEDGILLELRITSRGYPPSFDDPGDGPEWELEGDPVCEGCGRTLTDDELMATESAQEKLVEELLSEPDDYPEPDYPDYPTDEYYSDYPYNLPEGM